MDINKIRDIANLILDDYFKNCSTTQRWLQDYRKETQAYKEYRGREIFELLQNADDAHSSKAIIRIDTTNNELTIINEGSETVPFTVDGFKSIMLSDLSPKKKDQHLIGAKGLGFRSILNWTDQITIKSDNISVRFGNDIISGRWKELSKNIINHKTYEAEASKDGRVVPLAVLANPEISNNNEHLSNSTIITLHYNEEVEEGILNDLKNFHSESLLFLHYLTSIEIDINKEKRIHNKVLISKNDSSNVSCYKLDGKEWIIASENGKYSENEFYETACAFCMNIPQDSYNIHCFFPTSIQLHLPCLLHATLELDSSRNSLLPDDKRNKEMMYKLVCVIKNIAKFLLENTHDWFAYKLMKPNQKFIGNNNYMHILFDALHDESEGMVLIPTLDGEYASDDAYYYYSDEFTTIVENMPKGKDIYPKMRLNNAPDYAWLKRNDPEYKNKAESFATLIDNNKDLSKFIAALLNSSISSFYNEKLYILRDEQGNNISGNAYINSGQTVNRIPGCRNISYVSQSLIETLKEELNISPEKKPLDSNRELADRLHKICSVSATDIHPMTQMLLPKKGDLNLSDKDKEEIISCAFQLYKERGNTLTIAKETVVYLISESGEWKEASELVMTDERFYTKPHSQFYAPSIQAKYPEYLETNEHATPSEIFEFYKCLGVNDFFKRKKDSFYNDYDYLNLLSLKKDILNNIHKSREKNVAWIGDLEFFDSLNLTELLEILLESGFSKSVCEKQKIYWFYSKEYTEEVDFSYASYKLRQIDSIKSLKYYAIDDDRWLSGFEPTPKPKFSSDYETRRLLEALGAKRNMSDFTADELYSAINRMEERAENGEKIHFQTEYHDIKTALNNKNAFIGTDYKLRMRCKVGSKYEFRDSRQIFYSDNNNLPDDVLKELPMLDMSRREGEVIVGKIFGCRSLKELKIKIDSYHSNDDVNIDFIKKLNKRKPYLLAFGSLGVGSRGAKKDTLYNTDFKSHLDNFVVRFVLNASYSYNIENCSYDYLSNHPRQMQEGELLYVDKQLYICTKSHCLDNAMQSPSFNNSVIEALCIVSNLASRDISNAFYRIFMSSDDELNYYREKEIDNDLWQECLQAFGVTNDDVRFWQKVFAVNGKEDFDEALLRTDSFTYLQNKLNIPTDRLTTDNFKQFHIDSLVKVRDNFEAGYRYCVHEKLRMDREHQSEYLSIVYRFTNNDWLEDILKQEDNIFNITLDYDRLVKDYALRRFDFNIDEYTNVKEPEKITRYLDNIVEFNLSIEDKSLLFFEGYDNYFKNKTINAVEAEEISLYQTTEKESDTQILSIKTSKFGEIYHKESENNNKKRTHKSSGHKQVSEQTKIRLGKEAEKRVYDALTASPDYEIVKLFSSTLSKTEGDDSAGFDLMYRRKGETTERMLEIKHINGNSFIMSSNEYNVSQNNKEIYDLALVNDKEIKIIPSAFAHPSNYKKTINDYTISFILT